MYILKGNVLIQRTNGTTYYFEAMHEVRIKKSIHDYFDTAIIELPTSARLKLQQRSPDGKKLLPVSVSFVTTAQEFHEGDRVTINLGYNDDLVQEFDGYISKVNFTTPCKIECEGYAWLLRNVDNLVTKSWTSVSLIDALNYILQATGNADRIKLSPDIQDATFGPLRLIQLTGAECLEQLKKLGFAVYFIGNTIYAGLEQLAQLNSSVIYSLGWNTIKDDQLKYRDADETKVQVEVNYKDKSGRVKTKVVGEKGGIMKRLNLGRELDMKLLEAKARAWARKYRHAGYEGRITTFLQPYALPGWKATIEDIKYQDRNGDYIILSTDVQYGMGGGRRIVEIGQPLTVTGAVAENWEQDTSS